MSHSTLTAFPHQRLDAYHVAQRLARRVVLLTKHMPRGFAVIRDQAQRSALATVRHIAEGASRETPADKRSRFVIARGEIAELEATLETAVVCDLIDEREASELRVLADRVGTMLTGLVRCECASRAGPGA